MILAMYFTSISFQSVEAAGAAPLSPPYSLHDGEREAAEADEPGQLLHGPRLRRPGQQRRRRPPQEARPLQVQGVRHRRRKGRRTPQPAGGQPLIF